LVSSLPDSIMTIHSNSSPSQQGRAHLIALDSPPVTPFLVSRSRLRGNI
jgi:hypothetical protein